MTEVHGFSEKRVSDNNFGGECAHVEFVAQLEDGDDAMACAELLLLQARTRVHADLAMSLHPGIRRQVELPHPPVKVAEADLEELPDFEEVR